MTVSVDTAEPDISMLALEATLTAMKGTGWTIESLRAIYNLIVALPPGLTAADVWTFAARTLTNLSDIRAGYIDNINNAQLLNVPNLATLTALRIGYLDNINNAQLLNISAAILARIDVAISSRLAAASYTAERGTDNAMLAASYVTERGTNNALLAASFPDSASYTAARAGFLDLLNTYLNASVAAVKAKTDLIGASVMPSTIPAQAFPFTNPAAAVELTNLFSNMSTVIPSDSNLFTNATERSAALAAYTLEKEINIGSIEGLLFRTYFELKTQNVTASYGKVYKNGAALGTERSTVSNVYVSYTEDLGPWVKGDLFQIYAKNAVDNFYVKDQKINGTRIGVPIATAGL